MMKMKVKDPCQKQACAIQKCLQANSYTESRCEGVIRAMRECCEVHAGHGSVSCSGFTPKPQAPCQSNAERTPPRAK